MKTYYFIRWGGLSAVKHKEHCRKNEHFASKDLNLWDINFHKAPRLKGIYAFPLGTIERFLIGGDFTKHYRQYLIINNKRVLVNDCYDEDGELLKSVKNTLKKLNIRERDLHSEYDEKLQGFVFTYFKRPKIFKHSGYIWSHLEYYVKKSDILDTSESWVKTTMPAYQKALKKSLMQDKFMTYLDNKIGGNPHTCPSWVTKNHYEVFIEHTK